MSGASIGGGTWGGLPSSGGLTGGSSFGGSPGPGAGGCGRGGGAGWPRSVRSLRAIPSPIVVGRWAGPLSTAIRTLAASRPETSVVANASKLPRARASPEPRGKSKMMYPASGSWSTNLVVPVDPQVPDRRRPHLAHRIGQHAGVVVAGHGRLRPAPTLGGCRARDPVGRDDEEHQAPSETSAEGPTSEHLCERARPAVATRAGGRRRGSGTQGDHRAHATRRVALAENLGHSNRGHPWVAPPTPDPVIPRIEIEQRQQPRRGLFAHRHPGDLRLERGRRVRRPRATREPPRGHGPWNHRPV